MFQIVDRVECDALQRSIVKPEALKKAVLVQDAGNAEQLFALLLIDGMRAVLVPQGSMSLNASTGSGMQKLQAFRNQLYRAGVSAYELKFCAPGTYERELAGGEHFNPEWFVEASFAELPARFNTWRAGKATW